MSAPSEIVVTFPRDLPGDGSPGDAVEDDKIDLDFEIDPVESAERSLAYSVGVVAKLLEARGHEKYISMFEASGVGIDQLRGCDDAALEKIGVDNFVHRAELLNACKAEIRHDPPKKDDAPVKVRMKWEVARLGRINTVEGTVAMKLYCDLYWHDYRLIGVAPDKVPEHLMWYPDAFFYNAIDGTGEDGGILHDDVTNLVNPKTGLCLRSMEMEVTCAIELNLRAFPFDENTLKLVFCQPSSQNSKDWEFEPPRDPTSCFTFMFNVYEIPEFDLTGYSMDFFNEEANDGLSYANVEVYLWIRRRPLYYIWNTMVPLFLTTTFAFTTFLYDVTALEQRANTAQTTLLTTVALLFVIGTLLPKTSYMTRINKYIMFCLSVQVSVWAVTCAFQINADFSDPDVLDALDAIDRRAAIIIPCIFFAVTLLTFTPPLVLWYMKSVRSKPTVPVKGRENQVLEYYPVTEENVQY